MGPCPVGACRCCETCFYRTVLPKISISSLHKYVKHIIGCRRSCEFTIASQQENARERLHDQLLLEAGMGRDNKAFNQWFAMFIEDAVTRQEEVNKEVDNGNA